MMPITRLGSIRWAIKLLWRPYSYQWPWFWTALGILYLNGRLYCYKLCFNIHQKHDQINLWFLAVQNSSIGLIVCPLFAWSDQTNNQSLHNTTEWPQRLVTFETFDQSDEKTCLRHLRHLRHPRHMRWFCHGTFTFDIHKHPRDLWPLRHLIRVMTWPNKYLSQTWYLSKKLRDHSLDARILRKKRLNRNISQFATKERKCFKMA